MARGFVWDNDQERDKQYDSIGSDMEPDFRNVDTQPQSKTKKHKKDKKWKKRKPYSPSSSTSELDSDSSDRRKERSKKYRDGKETPDILAQLETILSRSAETTKPKDRTRRVRGKR